MSIRLALLIVIERIFER